ncbi:MAG: sugar ABC transporter permease, partial [Ruminococcaceae bacterium]|nr:sugar ABC transporter permease [Oscillospiraceae bacterium]
MNNKAAKNTAAVKAVKPKKGIAKRLAKFGFFFCIPFVIIFLVFSVYPVFRTFQMSFMNYKGFGKETFAGFGNYVRVFKDTLFWDAFLNTL